METYTFDPNKKKTEKKEEIREKVTPVVTEKPTNKKDNKVLSKLVSLFISEDVKDIKSYLVKDIVVPTIKTAIGSVISMTFGLDVRESVYSRSRLPMERVSYSAAYNASNIRRRYDERDEREPLPDNKELIFSSRGDAEAVLMGLESIIERYNTARINDLYDLAERGDLCTLSGQNYGWKDLHSAKVINVRNGYVIKMPKAFPLD